MRRHFECDYESDSENYSEDDSAHFHPLRFTGTLEKVDDIKKAVFDGSTVKYGKVVEEKEGSTEVSSGAVTQSSDGKQRNNCGDSDDSSGRHRVSSSVLQESGKDVEPSGQMSEHHQGQSHTLEELVAQPVQGSTDGSDETKLPPQNSKFCAPLDGEEVCEGKEKKRIKDEGKFRKEISTFYTSTSEDHELEPDGTAGSDGYRERGEEGGGNVLGGPSLKDSKLHPHSDAKYYVTQEVPDGVMISLLDANDNDSSAEVNRKLLSSMDQMKTHGEVSSGPTLEECKLLIYWLEGVWSELCHEMPIGTVIVEILTLDVIKI